MTPTASPSPSPAVAPKASPSPDPSPGPEPSYPLPPPTAPRSPALTYRVVGALHERARVRLVVEAIAIARSARIEARIRPAGKRVYEPFMMPWVDPPRGRADGARTSSVAALELTLDDPWYEVYFEARQGKKVLARAGSADAPILIEAQPVPSLSDAYAAPPPGARAAGSSGEEASPTGPPPADGAVAATTTSTTVAALPPSSGLSATQAALLAGGLLATALIVVLVVVATSGGPDDCPAPEGRGCTEVRILPLMRF